MITESMVLNILLRCRGVTINIDTLKSDLPLNTQGIDSLDISMFMFELEAKLGIPIPTSEIGNLQSITDFVNYFNRASEIRVGSENDVQQGVV